MADINGKQNVQTSDNGDVAIKIVDGTTPSQEATVSATGEVHTLGYGFNGTSNVPLPIDASSGGVQVDIVSADGVNLTVDIDQFEDGAATQAGDKGTVAMGIDGSNNYQFLSVDTSGALNVITQAPVQVSSDGNANTALNPIFVENVGSGVSSDDIHEFGTTASVANSADHTTSYTVSVGKVLCLRQCSADCSGRAKVTVEVNNVVKEVRFVDVAAPGAVIEFPSPIKVPAGQVVEVIVTNRSLIAQDLYASINGEEIDA